MMQKLLTVNQKCPKCGTLFPVSNDRKVEPQVIRGIVDLPTESVEIDTNAVKNNNSTQSSEAFVKALEEARKENTFTPEDLEDGQ